MFVTNKYIIIITSHFEIIEGTQCGFSLIAKDSFGRRHLFESWSNATKGFFNYDIFVFRIKHKTTELVSFESALWCIIKSDWLQPSFGALINYLFVQNAAVNWVNTGCKLSSRSSDFFKFDIVCCQALLQVKANLCILNAITCVVIFYTDTKSLEQELMKFLVQKGKIPYAWQEALISTSAVSIMYHIYILYDIHLFCLNEELFCENVHVDYWVLLNLIYLIMTESYLFIMISS